jgi:hypothetical protein
MKTGPSTSLCILAGCDGQLGKRVRSGIERNSADPGIEKDLIVAVQSLPLYLCRLLHRADYILNSLLSPYALREHLFPTASHGLVVTRSSFEASLGIALDFLKV